MSLWNPYAFTPTGQRTSVSAPPALRCIGGKPTPAQLGMAQAAFAAFCGRSRVSFWQNPNEQGRLPDGTVYRIVSVGNQQIMQIWPMSSEDRQPFRFLFPLGFVYEREQVVNDVDLWIEDGDERLRSVTCHDKVLSSWEMNKLTKEVKSSGKILAVQDDLLNRTHAKTWSSDGKKSVFLPAIVGDKAASLGTYMHGLISPRAGSAGLSISDGSRSINLPSSPPVTPYTELVRRLEGPIVAVQFPENSDFFGTGPRSLLNAAILHGRDRVYDLLTGISLKDYGLFAPKDGPRFLIHLNAPTTLRIAEGESFNLEFDITCCGQAPGGHSSEGSTWQKVGTFSQNLKLEAGWRTSYWDFATHRAFSPDGSKIVLALYAYTSGSLAGSSAALRDVRLSEGVFAAWEFTFSSSTGGGPPSFTMKQIVTPADWKTTSEHFPNTVSFEAIVKKSLEVTCVANRSNQKMTVKAETRIVWETAYTQERISWNGVASGVNDLLSTSEKPILIAYNSSGGLVIFSGIQEFEHRNIGTQVKPLIGLESDDPAYVPFPGDLNFIGAEGSCQFHNFGDVTSTAVGEYQVDSFERKNNVIKLNGSEVARTSKTNYGYRKTGKYYSVCQLGSDVVLMAVSGAVNSVSLVDEHGGDYEIASNNVVILKKSESDGAPGSEIGVTPNGVFGLSRTASEKALDAWAAWNPITNEISTTPSTSWC